MIAAVLVLASPVAIAACGGSSPKKSSHSGVHFSAFLAFSECMRLHGVTNFPDPFAAPNGPPSLNPAHYSTIQDMGGEVIAIPRSIDTNSPVFKQAAQACKFQ